MKKINVRRFINVNEGDECEKIYKYEKKKCKEIYISSERGKLRIWIFIIFKSKHSN